MRRPLAAAALAVVPLLLAQARFVAAQDLEVTPFAGHRFGGDFFELITQQPLDIDGTSAFGVVVDAPVSEGVQVEVLFTHQAADLFVPSVPNGRPLRWRMRIDHWQAGGLQELSPGRVRPFLNGTAGLTRYAGEGDSEIRFALGGGAGVKLFPSDRFGVRLSSQVFATFVDADANLIACSARVCVVGIDTDVVWQIEFTAGLIVRFP